jgi:AcrR family transcriptional regulator
MQASPHSASGAGDAPTETERVCSATVELIAEFGYEAVTEEMIRERSGLGESEFHRHFESKDACCIAALERIAHAFEAEVLTAFGAHEQWRDALRASAYAAARFVAENERDARFGTYELMRAGPHAQSRREATLQPFIDLIDAGRRELPEPESLSRSTAEAVVGSIVGLLVKRLSAPRPADIELLVPELMFIAVRPYLGDEAARQELRIPSPPRAPRAEGGPPAAEGRAIGLGGEGKRDP